MGPGQEEQSPKKVNNQINRFKKGALPHFHKLLTAQVKRALAQSILNNEATQFSTARIMCSSSQPRSICRDLNIWSVCLGVQATCISRNICCSPPWQRYLLQYAFSLFSPLRTSSYGPSALPLPSPVSALWSPIRFSSVPLPPCLSQVSFVDDAPRRLPGV